MNLKSKIDALNPWFYPLTIGKITVVPGVRSGLAPDYLANRIQYRKTLLVDEVAKRYGLSNKKILDVGCNCGYWSAQYIKHGAVSVVGLEGRQKYVNQANLYFSTNNITKDFKFICANIADKHIWDKLSEKFDLVLCAGILYHIPNYPYVLRRIANITNDALVIDTRVSSSPEVYEKEPGDLHFNAIKETRKKIVPNFAHLKKILRDLGFNVEMLPVKFNDIYGLTGIDSYNKKNRVTLFCTR
jgi:2-polyprenyl-3-methyl-5-hydroxy-6-metoxy-1,4-benzoquinol methylase